MPLHLANRVKETSISSGSGIIVLGGAPATYQPFSSALSDGDITYYTVVDNSNWEVGIGTYSSNTLTRDIILSSSNSNNKISLDGSSNVFIVYPSEKSVYKDQNGQVLVGSSGIIIQSGIPTNISNALYNIGNELYFNGYPLRTETVDESYTLVTTVFNKNGSALPKFTVVYISGAQGDLPAVTPAIGNGEPKSSKTFGITKEQIPAMSSGHVVIYGNIYGINTDQYNPTAPHGDINGQVLYLSPTVSGGLTITKPYAPNHLVSVGTVIRTHQNEGIFNVRIQNGFEMEELHNVSSTGSISGQFLKYNGSYWVNTNIASSDIADFSSAVSGISPNITISGASGISVDKNGNSYTIYTTGNFGLTSSQVQSLLNSGVSIYITDGTGNFSSLSVGGTPVSVSGHTHSSLQITDFNSSVSGLLPSISGSGYATVTYNNNTYIVAATGLQPSGNYSLVGHTHIASNITDFNTSVSGLLSPYALLNSPNFSGVPTAPTASSGTNTTQLATTQFVRTEISNLVSAAPSTLDTLNELAAALGNDPNFATSVTNNLANKANLSGASFSGLITSPSGDFVVLRQNGTVVSVSGHTHTVSNITDFNSATSGLLTPYALLDSGNFNTLFVTGVPVSLSGHSHFSSSISDFNSSVSGLLTVTNIIGVSGILVTSSGTEFTVAVTGSTGGGATINDPGSGRLILSDGTSNGLVAQTGLTFDGRSVFVNGVNIKNGQNLYMWSNFR